MTFRADVKEGLWSIKLVAVYLGTEIIVNDALMFVKAITVFVILVVVITKTPEM